MDDSEDWFLFNAEDNIQSNSNVFLPESEVPSFSVSFPYSNDLKEDSHFTVSNKRYKLNEIFTSEKLIKQFKKTSDFLLRPCGFKHIKYFNDKNARSLCEFLAYFRFVCLNYKNFKQPNLMSMERILFSNSYDCGNLMQTPNDICMKLIINLHFSLYKGCLSLKIHDDELMEKLKSNLFKDFCYFYLKVYENKRKIFRSYTNNTSRLGVFLIKELRDDFYNYLVNQSKSGDGNFLSMCKDLHSLEKELEIESKLDVVIEPCVKHILLNAKSLQMLKLVMENCVVCNKNILLEVINFFVNNLDKFETQSILTLSNLYNQYEKEPFQKFLKENFRNLQESEKKKIHKNILSKYRNLNLKVKHKRSFWINLFIFLISVIEIFNELIEKNIIQKSIVDSFIQSIFSLDVKLDAGIILMGQAIIIRKLNGDYQFQAICRFTEGIKKLGNNNLHQCMLIHEELVNSFLENHKTSFRILNSLLDINLVKKYLTHNFFSSEKLLKHLLTITTKLRRFPQEEEFDYTELCDKFTNKTNSILILLKELCVKESGPHETLGEFAASILMMVSNRTIEGDIKDLLKHFLSFRTVNTRFSCNFILNLLEHKSNFTERFVKSIQINDLVKVWMKCGLDLKDSSLFEQLSKKIFKLSEFDDLGCDFVKDDKKFQGRILELKNFIKSIGVNNNYKYFNYLNMIIELICDKRESNYDEKLENAEIISTLIRWCPNMLYRSKNKVLQTNLIQKVFSKIINIENKNEFSSRIYLILYDCIEGLSDIEGFYEQKNIRDYILDVFQKCIREFNEEKNPIYKIFSMNESEKKSLKLQQLYIQQLSFNTVQNCDKRKELEILSKSLALARDRTSFVRLQFVNLLRYFYVLQNPNMKVTEYNSLVRSKNLLVIIFEAMLSDINSIEATLENYLQVYPEDRLRKFKTVLHLLEQIKKTKNPRQANQLIAKLKSKLNTFHYRHGLPINLKNKLNSL